MDEPPRFVVACRREGVVDVKTAGLSQLLTSASSPALLSEPTDPSVLATVRFNGAQEHRPAPRDRVAGDSESRPQFQL